MMNLKSKLLVGIIAVSIIYNVFVYTVYQDKLEKKLSRQEEAYRQNEDTHPDHRHILPQHDGSAHGLMKSRSPFKGKDVRTAATIVPVKVYNLDQLDPESIDTANHVDDVSDKGEAQPQAKGLIVRVFNRIAGLLGDGETWSREDEFDGEGEISLTSKDRTYLEDARKPPDLFSQMLELGLREVSEQGYRVKDMTDSFSTSDTTAPEVDLPVLNALEFHGRQFVEMQRIPLKGETLAPLPPALPTRQGDLQGGRDKTRQPKHRVMKSKDVTLPPDVRKRLTIPPTENKIRDGHTGLLHTLNEGPTAVMNRTASKEAALSKGNPNVANSAVVGKVPQETPNNRSNTGVSKWNKARDPHEDLLALLQGADNFGQTTIPTTTINHVDTKDLLRVLDVRNNKIILLHTGFFNTVGWGLELGQAVFSRLQCRVQSCAVTADRRVTEHADAVLFHLRDVKWNPRNIPKVRHARQRYVIASLETPFADHVPEGFERFFNWTMSYRMHADINVRYGSVIKTSNANSAPVDYLSRIKNKSRPVAWMVSNCKTQSRRERYVEELQLHIDVDVYGACGSYKCRRDHTDRDAKCMSMINQTYYFYLAFENTLCQDYVTEKLYMTLNQDVVPVVRGMTDYSRLSPKKWYIDTDQFKSPKELAAYLKYLIDNPYEYIQFLKGREQYDIIPNYGLRDVSAWCDLCEKLHENNPESVRDLSKLWSRDKECKQPTDLESWFGGIVVGTTKLPSRHNNKLKSVH